MERINQIINGNCLEVIPSFPDNVIDAVLIDPPYGEGMDYAGDDNINEAENLLSAFLKAVEPKLKRNAHIAIFWTMRNLDVCIDCLKSSGFTYRRTLSMYLPKGGARPYLGWLPRTQPIVIGQKYLPKQPSEFHAELASYLSKYLAEKQVSKSDLARQLGCDSRLVMKWTRLNDPAWCLPTPRFYKPLKDILGLDNQFDILLEREPVYGASSRKDFEYKHDTYIVDEKKEKSFHPSQKPLSVIEHLVCCLCPENGIILDGFAGSGTTALAAKNTGRNFVAIEVSKEFQEIGLERIK